MQYEIDNTYIITKILSIFDNFFIPLRNGVSNNSVIKILIMENNKCKYLGLKLIVTNSRHTDTILLIQFATKVELCVCFFTLVGIV